MRQRRRLAAVVWLALVSRSSSSDATCSGGCECAARLSVCVPTAPAKDLKIFEKSLASLAAFVEEATDIWVVARRDPGIEAAIGRVDSAERPVRFLDENDATLFPFNYTWVRAALSARSDLTQRGAKQYEYFVGWYLQQLLKLYCGRAIEKISGRPEVDALAVDSDVVLFRPVAFVEATRRIQHRCSATYRYAFSRESHAAYIATNDALLGEDSFRLFRDSGDDAPSGTISGVAHHMVFRADVVAEIEARVRERHGVPLYEALLGRNGVVREPRSNAFSEYQLYFNFARANRPVSVAIRQLYWGNGPGPDAVVRCGPSGWPVGGAPRRARYALEALDVDKEAGYDFVAYHSYAKRRPCVYAPHRHDGLCFGPGCTFSCHKRPDAPKYQQLNRSEAAPRLCAAAAPTTTGRRHHQ